MITFFNANIFDSVTESAIAIDGNKIIALGSDKTILDNYGKVADSYNLNGMTIWPGLIDSHIHLGQLARSLRIVDCETKTLADCLIRVSEHAALHPEFNWIEGHGWNQNEWEDAHFGTAQQLDTVTGDRPAYLTAKSLHAAWANSKALSLAQIDESSKDPEGGVIIRDPAGKPNGILLESAMNLVERIIPKSSPSRIIDDLMIVQQHLWEMGITGIHDYDGPEVFQALQSLKGRDRLNLRIQKNFPISELENLITIGLYSGFGDDLLHTGSIKLFADGALGPQTAAMLEPYENSESKGILLLSRQDLFDIGVKAVKNGWSLTIHAIGDKANHDVLDGLSDLRKFEDSHNIPHLPHRIEHAQLVQPEDQVRFKMLGITASVQPIHCTSDMNNVDKYWGSRASNAYPIRNLLDLKTHVVFGSDAPVESANPFYGIHAAVTRRRQDGTPNPEGWQPSQRITMREAVNAYTINVSTLSGMENRCGKVRPGYYADLIVLPVDPFVIAEQDLYKIKPVLTMVNGQVVYKSSNL